MFACNGVLVLINRTGMLFLLGTIVYQCSLLAVLRPIRLSGTTYDPKRTINVTNNPNICSEQREPKMCQVDSIYYVSPVVVPLSTLPDTG